MLFLAFLGFFGSTSPSPVAAALLTARTLVGTVSPSSLALSISSAPSASAVSVSAPKNTPFVSSSHSDSSQTPKLSNITDPDVGYTYGNVVVINNCDYPLYLRSVGAWYLKGFRNVQNPAVSWGTPEDDYINTIGPGNTHTESYRVTASCPNAKVNNVSMGQYCPQQDKLGGQAVSMKVAKSKETWQNILQIEYALFQNPDRGDKFRRLDYDISLLNCATPPVENITDITATAEDHVQKVAQCAGYDGGIAVSFSNNTLPSNSPSKGGNGTKTNCPPIWCDGKEKCMMIYMWDRTRDKEASLACEEEFYGNMTVDLCATKGPNARQEEDSFRSFAKSATLEVLNYYKTAGVYQGSVSGIATGNSSNKVLSTSISTTGVSRTTLDASVSTLPSRSSTSTPSLVSTTGSTLSVPTSLSEFSMPISA